MFSAGTLTPLKSLKPSEVIYLSESEAAEQTAGFLSGVTVLSKQPEQVITVILTWTKHNKHQGEANMSWKVCFDSPSSSLCGLFLLPFACSRRRSSSGVGQTLFVCGDDVVVKPLIKLSDDVTPTAVRREKIDMNRRKGNYLMIYCVDNWNWSLLPCCTIVRITLKLNVMWSRGQMEPKKPKFKSLKY